MSPDDIKLLKKRLEREKLARKQAEKILEDKALELYEANQSLTSLNQNLEAEISKRSASLAVSEKKYRQLVEQAQDLIYNVDHNGYFTFVNSLSLKKLGFQENDVIGKKFLDLIPSHDKKKAEEHFEKVKNSTEGFDYQEFRIYNKRGHLVWLGQHVTKVNNDDGSFFFNVVARDISKRIMTEQALAQVKLALEKSEVKYRSIIENMELGLMEVDTEGTILRVYDSFNKMLGYNEGELEGKNAIKALLVEGYESILLEEDNNRKKGNSGVYEVKVKRKDGSHIWVLISGAPFYNEKGEIIGSIGVHYNITERKELEQQLELERHKAIKAQQAEKAFLANMSHEIRTPLNAIIGMTHLLADTTLDSEQKDYIQSLLASTSILKSLISDVLDISKIDSGSLEVVQKSVNIIALGKKLIHTFDTTNTRSTLNFEFTYDSRITFNVFTDPQLLNQILMNLLSNANKFTDAGKVKLDIQLVNENDKKATILFDVSDSGIGIPKEEVELIFKEFKQANAKIRAKYGGTGLGLTISDQLSRLLGGQLNVKSEVGQGSSFFFKLTLPKRERTEDKAEIGHLFKPSNHSSKRVLVVEDNDMNLKYITTLLTKWNLPFDISRDGEDAYKKAQTIQYSLIFMDLQMPIMDGFTATQQIRSLDHPNSDIPIIALTASTFLSKKRMALAAGMTNFLSKPFTPDQLVEILNQYLFSVSSQNTIEDVIPFIKELDNDYLIKAYGSDVDYALGMFETFKEVITEELILIKEDAKEQQLDDLAKKLHKIKPTFTMVGLHLLSQKTADLESVLKEKKSIDTVQIIQELESHIIEILPLIDKQIIKLKEWQKN